MSQEKKKVKDTVIDKQNEVFINLIKKIPT